MKSSLFFSLLLTMSCGSHNGMEMSIDSKTDDSKAAGGSCIYHPTESVILEFKRAVLEGDQYEITFVVKEQNGNQFTDYAAARKGCKEDFEKQKTVPGTIRRIKYGTCNPVSVFPQNYGIDCWTIR